MNLYEPKVYVTPALSSLYYEIRVMRRSPRGMESLQHVEGDTYEWVESPEGVAVDPLLAVDSDVYAALCAALVDHENHERQEGRIEVLKEALEIERARVDRILP